MIQQWTKETSHLQVELKSVCVCVCVCVCVSPQAADNKQTSQIHGIWDSAAYL